MTFPFEFHLTPEQREREGVERRELSSVFQVYAQRLAARTLTKGWRAHGSLLEPPRAEWLRLARRFLQSLRERGRSCVGTALLRALMERERVGFDVVTPLDPVELMSTAVRIWPSPETYLGLGQLLLAGERVAGFALGELRPQVPAAAMSAWAARLRRRRERRNAPLPGRAGWG